MSEAQPSSAGAPPLLRWGFMSTANIGRKNRRAAELSSPSNSVSAVGSRNSSSAEAFAAEQNIPRAYGSYSELVTDPELDAVYLPIPTGIRTEWALRCAEAGKHLLCEKPLAKDVQEAQQLAAVCQRNGLLLMDGLMFMHHPRYKEIQRRITDREKFGKIISVQTGFSFPGLLDQEFLKDIRVNKELEPMGVLGDLGWYNVRFSLFAYEFEIPLAVSAFCHRETQGVPTDMTATIFWSDGRQAHFQASFHARRRQNAEITGEKHCLFLRDFVNVFREDESNFWVTANDEIMDREEVTFPPTVQEAEMFSNFAQLAQKLKQRQQKEKDNGAGADAEENKEERNKGTKEEEEEERKEEQKEKLAGGGDGGGDGGGKQHFDYENPEFWPKIAILTQAILDACMRSMDRNGRLTKVWPGLCDSAAELRESGQGRKMMLSDLSLQELINLDFSPLEKEPLLRDA